MDIMIYDSTGSLQGSTGWYLMVLGQNNLVLIGIEWYWVDKGLLCRYILKKLMVTSTNRPTDRPTGRIQSNLPFRMLENRKKAEICNYRLVLTYIWAVFLPFFFSHLFPNFFRYFHFQAALVMDIYRNIRNDTLGYGGITAKRSKHQEIPQLMICSFTNC